MFSKRNIFVFFALLASFAALAFNFFLGTSAKDYRPSKPDDHLLAAIPMQIGIWQGKDVPLGATEEVVRASESLLNLNQFLCREYKAKDGREFSLYISYWAQGKEPTSKAASHVPDNCWGRNGFKQIREKDKYGEELEIGGAKLQPVYEREFSIKANDGKIYTRKVWYWFLVEGKSYVFGSGSNAVPSPINFIKNMLNQAREGIPEQYFVRLDSNEDMHELYKDEDFKSLLNDLGKLVLFENKTAEDAK